MFLVESAHLSPSDFVSISLHLHWIGYWEYDWCLKAEVILFHVVCASDDLWEIRLGLRVGLVLGVRVLHSDHSMALAAEIHEV
jgi:hypothetical protein